MASIEPLAQAPHSAGSSHASRLILFLTVFIDLLGFGIVIPFLPMFVKQMGVSAFGAGLAFAIYSLMQFLCAPMLGRVSDRIGRKPVIMLGLLGSAASYVIYGFASTFFWLMVSRAVHGACAGTISTAQAYIADTTDEKDRARGMGMIGAAFGLGFVLGPAVGGLLGQSGLRLPVFFAAALTFANFIFAAIRLPESHHPDRSAPVDLHHFIAPILAIPRNLASHKLSRLFTIAFLITFALSALEVTFALMVPAVYGYGATGVGVLLAVAGVMQAVSQGYLLGRVVRRIGEIPLARWGLIAMAIGFAPMGTVTSHWVLFAGLSVLSLGYGLASPSIASLISRSTASHMQGEVLGINQSALSLARICGPVAGGLLYNAMGPAAPYLGGTAVAVLALTITGTVVAGEIQH
jgi:multidrug resistance protein